MSYELQGSVAIVSGGSRGIGAAIVLALADAGCDVAFSHVGDAENAAGILAQIEARGRRALARESDVSSSEATEAFFVAAEERLGPVRVVVCNAGITRDGVVWKMTDAAWDAVIAVNLTGCFNAVRAAARRFRARKGTDLGGGRIVTITSINGLRGKFGQLNYSASKGGIVAMTKAAARELGGLGVTVNTVAPGMVMTEMARGLPETILAKARAETVLGRLADPEDIAGAVAFLCSERARHVTGQCLQVDGGQYI
jgi:3-oxoacyl-[acyl-carrier protein] reductase